MAFYPSPDRKERSMSVQREKILYRAEFDPKWKVYCFMQVLLVFAITFIGIPLIPFWLLGWGQWYSRRYFENLHCHLGERSLMVGRGIYFRVEKTIPLDKIQDLTLREGPVQKAFGLLQLQIETAGQGGAQGASEAKLIGVKDAREFRNRVLDQRDKLAMGQGSSDVRRAVAGESRATALGSVDRLIEIGESNQRTLEQILEAVRANR
jgi:putative membrane protein